MISKSSSLLWCISNSDCLLLFERLLVDDTVEMDEGDDGMELECDEEGGESKSWNDDSSGSFSFSSFSQPIKSSSSLKLIIFFSTSSSSSSSAASIISNIVFCKRQRSIINLWQTSWFGLSAFTSTVFSWLSSWVVEVDSSFLVRSNSSIGIPLFSANSSSS